VALSDHVWVTQKGEEIPVAELEINHLRNALKMLVDGRSRHPREWIPILDAELVRRVTPPYEASIDLDSPADGSPIAHTKLSCGNCPWRGDLARAKPIVNAFLTPGDPSPVACCPDCESLLYVDSQTHWAGLLLGRAPPERLKELATAVRRPPEITLALAVLAGDESAWDALLDRAREKETNRA
jgi:hypothetical protein